MSRRYPKAIHRSGATMRSTQREGLFAVNEYALR